MARKHKHDPYGELDREPEVPAVVVLVRVVMALTLGVTTDSPGGAEAPAHRWAGGPLSAWWR